MEEKINLIPELVQQIRNAENNHNQLVDQYFAMKEHVQQALTNLNNDPSSNHMLAYHHYSIHSETIMKAIRVQRQTLTNLICDLQEQGVSLDDDESDNDSFNELSSLDEGIDDHASSVLDASSKLSSHESSEIHPDDDDVLV